MSMGLAATGATDVIASTVVTKVSVLLTPKKRSTNSMSTAKPDCSVSYGLPAERRRYRPHRPGRPRHLARRRRHQRLFDEECVTAATAAIAGAGLLRNAQAQHCGGNALFGIDTTADGESAE